MLQFFLPSGPCFMASKQKKKASSVCSCTGAEEGTGAFDGVPYLGIFGWGSDQQAGSVIEMKLLSVYLVAYINSCSHHPSL